MVTLYVGEEGKTSKFLIHKKLLCTKVPYFEAMFGGSFKEAEEGVGHLPEDSHVAIELLLEWLYRGFLSPMIPEEGADRLANRALARKAVGKWTEVFYLAEKYCIESLMDESLALIKTTHKKNHM